MNMKISLPAAGRCLLSGLLLIAPGGAGAQSPPCHQAVQAARLTQESTAERGMTIANRIMSGLTDELFNLDCINKISLFGGIRFHRPDDLIALLRKESCDQINQWVDKANARITRSFSGWDDQFGLQLEAGARTEKAEPVAVHRRVVDLNGDVQIGLEAPPEQDTGDNLPLGQALRELFR